MISLLLTVSMNCRSRALRHSEETPPAACPAPAPGAREQRDQAARPFDELQIGDEVAQLLQILARQKRLAFQPRPARRIRSP